MIDDIIYKHLLCFHIRREREIYKMCMELINEIKEKQPCENTESAIKIANKILEKLKINTMPVDISKILTGLGFKIYVSDMFKGNISGMICISPDLKQSFDTDKIIIVSKEDNIGRQRFTLAHEFCHYIFDFNCKTMSSYVDAYDINKADCDSEMVSSRFAAELLIPEKFFIDKIKKLHANKINYYDAVSDLMDYFNVSKKSIEKRFVELQDKIPNNVKKDYLNII